MSMSDVEWGPFDEAEFEEQQSEPVEEEDEP
jgi:hypothetical protein